jgi:Ig-like domain-containing protein/IPT/TIG domain-containing protein
MESQEMKETIMNQPTKRMLFSVLAAILLLAACAPAPAGTPEPALAQQLMEQAATPTLAAPVTPSPSPEAVDTLPDLTTPPTAPIVESISPNTGFLGGGTTVTITGKNFVVGRGKIDFYFRDKAATDVVCESTTQCIAKTPQGIEGSVTVKAVLVAENPGENSNSDTFTFTGLDPNIPIIENVTPPEGPARGGIEVTVTGQNFLIGKQGVNAITRFFFGENEATDVVCDFTTRCKMKSPQGLEGIVLVQAQNNDLKSQHAEGNDHDGFKYNGIPKYGCDALTTAPKNLTIFGSGENFVIKWIVKNSGENTWPAGMDVKYSSGVNMGDINRVEIPVIMKPNDTYAIKINAVAPSNPGTYYMTWIVEGMGCNAYVAIVVE